MVSGAVHVAFGPHSVQLRRRKEDSVWVITPRTTEQEGVKGKKEP